MWRHDRPYPCFIVNWSVARDAGMKRFFYGRGKDRKTALRDGIALRARKTGEDFDQLVAQSELGGFNAS